MTPHKHFKNPVDQRKGPNCGVTACAIAAGVSFTHAWNTFKTMGVSYYARPRWKGGTMPEHYERFFKWHDCKFEQWDGNKKTVKHFVENEAQPDQLYLLVTGSHAQLVMNGWAIDQGGAKPVSEYRSKRCKVERVIHIKTPFKHAVEEKAQPATIPTQSHDTLFPSLFRDSKRDTAHSSATQLALF